MSSLTIKQLRYVEAAGRTGSIAAAATDMNISQSSITAAIDALEAETGYDLFTRVPAKGLMITSAGQQCIALITDFLGDFREFESELGAIGGTSSGVIRLACFAAAAAACSAACRPINDKRGTIAYRTKVAGVLLKRAVAIAAERASRS